MKKLSILTLVFLALLSCKEGEENLEQDATEDKKEADQSNLHPLQNMYGSDSIDASGNIVYGEASQPVIKAQPVEEDLGYRLGIRPDEALVNQYGDDSIDAQGNPVYPPRDTIWDEE